MAKPKLILSQNFKLKMVTAAALACFTPRTLKQTINISVPKVYTTPFTSLEILRCTCLFLIQVHNLKLNFLSSKGSSVKNSLWEHQHRPKSGPQQSLSDQYVNLSKGRCLPEYAPDHICGKGKKRDREIKRTSLAIPHYVFKIPTQSASSLPCPSEKGQNSWKLRGLGQVQLQSSYLFPQLEKVSSKHEDVIQNVKFQFFIKQGFLTLLFKQNSY